MEATLGVEPPTWLGDALGRERAYLLRFARRRLPDPGSVEDVVQETLLSAWLHGSRFAHRSSLRTWLTAILRRRIADAVRRLSRDLPSVADMASDRLRDDDGRSPALSEQDRAADSIDPERLLESRQTLAEVMARLAVMPPRIIKLVELRAMGLSNEEVAHEMGMPPARSALLTHRVRQQLRRDASPGPDGATVVGRTPGMSPVTGTAPSA